MNNLIICRAIFDDDEVAREIYEIFSSFSKEEQNPEQLRNISDAILETKIANYYKLKNEDARQQTECQKVKEELRKFIQLYVYIIDCYKEYIEKTKEGILNTTFLENYIDHSQANIPEYRLPSMQKKYLVQAAVYNVCSTDYTAVAAYSFLLALCGIGNRKETLNETISTAIPLTSAEKQDEKADIRKSR